MNQTLTRRERYSYGAAFNASGKSRAVETAV
jgi:hypothetical protein